MAISPHVAGGVGSSVLREVQVTVFPSSTCASRYEELVNYDRIWPQGIGEETLCAGEVDGGKDACQVGSLFLQAYQGRFITAV